MTTKYYRCTLLQDVVLNASLATEGNMETLDYIPGSNFLGIVAAKIYSESADQAYDLLHSGQVCFGDGLIMHNDIPYHAMPNCFLQDKLKNDISNDPVYLDYAVDHVKGIRNEKGELLQLKQMRTGFISAEGLVIQDIPKSFSLKSAYNRIERRTEEGKMFGFEAIQAGTEFLFSIQYEHQEHIAIIENHLLGRKQIGKSRSAEYGSVNIESFKNEPKLERSTNSNFTIVYAASNLCFIDESTGQQTFEPTIAQLGLEGGDICWDKSQIRTFSYSPWNSKRNTSSMQRHCIKMGSIIYVENAKGIPTSPKPVGEYINEGLGRLIYDPPFLLARKDDGKISGLSFQKIDLKAEIKSSKEANIKIDTNTPAVTNLGKYLQRKNQDLESERALAKEINDMVKKYQNSDLGTKITSSQWGNVRAEATKFLTGKIDDTHEANLKKYGLWAAFVIMLGFYNDGTTNGKYQPNTKSGLITTGKMSEKLWKEQRLSKMADILNAVEKLEISEENKILFMVKFASEMAKAVINNKNNS